MVITVPGAYLDLPEEGSVGLYLLKVWCYQTML